MSLPQNESPEETRKRLISHEASIRAIGDLYYWGSALSLFVSVVCMFAPAEPLKDKVIGIAISLLICAISVLVGRKYRALDRGVKVPGTMLAAIGLLAFPLGTLINIYILYLLYSKKSAEVFSDEYKAVIAATPQVKYKYSIIVWIGIVILVLVLGAMVIALLKKA